MTSYKQPSNNINIPNHSIHNYSKNKNRTVTLGNYKIRKKSIGKGSFSKIYIGNSISTGEQIAVKIINTGVRIFFVKVLVFVENII